MKTTSKPMAPDESNLLNVCIQTTKEEFAYPWHFHNECELTYIFNGHGQRYVGNNVETFTSDELVLLGSNLPHCWVNEGNAREHQPYAVVVYIKEDFFEGSWFNSSEFESIKSLLDLSKKGIKYNLETSQRFREKCLTLTTLHPVKKLTCLVDILQDLSELTQADYRLLCKQPYSGELNSLNSERINAIYRYIEKNYKKKISLNDVAEGVYMSAGYFSRFFSHKMKKPFFEFLNEYRISQACKQLIETEKAVSEICFDVGYESIPYFNRQFKKIKGCSPREFRENYKKAFT